MIGSLRRWLAGSRSQRLPTGDALDAGLECLREGDVEAAERAARAELGRNPDSAGAAFLLGMVAQSRDLPEAALEQFALALGRAPAHYDAALKAGLVLRGLGRSAESLRYFDAAVAIRADAATLNERAIALMEAGRLTQAEADLRRALAMTPEASAAHCNLGIVLRRTGAGLEAIDAFERAVTLDPRSVVAHCNLAASLRDRDRHGEALERLETGLAIDPGHRDARVLKGLLLREMGHPLEALEVLSLLGPMPEALCNQGLALQDLGRFDEAGVAFERARKHSTHAHQAIFNHGMLRLLQGAYSEGWREYEHRYFTDETPRRDYGCPDWWGEALDGKTILVYPEQGLGDEIMFASCFADLLVPGARVAIECDPRLGGLFGRAFPGAEVIVAERAQGRARVRERLSPDFQIAAGSLPNMFRTRDDAFPGTPFLRADPARVAAWRQRLRALGPGPFVGLAWRGGLARTRSAARSLEVTTLAPLLRDAPAHFVCLQQDASDEELDWLAQACKGRFARFELPQSNLDELAALVVALDVVTTVCQTLVHLCGGLGRPCMVLAPFVPEWRYGLEPGAMRWYRSVRVERQARPGDWTQPLERVTTQLAAFGRTTGQS